jgi:hypothetical protein
MAASPIFTKEADFRRWFEANLSSVGVKEVILSQEVCPDYVVVMIDGQVAKIEAELFDVNFRYHRHEPAKVDYVLACYSRADSIDGVPVIAVNKLHTWEPTATEPVPADAPLTAAESDLLATLLFTGGVSVAALGEGSFAGDQTLWLHFAPATVAAIPRSRDDDSLMTVLPPKAKRFIRKYHHALIGAGLSASACEAIDSLQRRGLVKYRPLAFLASLMDGGLVDHPAFVPIEAYATAEAHERYGKQLSRHLFRPTSAKPR